MNTDTKPARKSAPKKTAAPKAEKAAVEPKAPAPAATPTKRKPVLISRSIADIKTFIGGDDSTVIEVSQRALIDLRTANDRKKAATLLDGTADDDL